MILGTTCMLPAVQKTVDAIIRQGAEVSSTPISSNQTDVPVLWQQWYITGLPPEVLSHIFSCLDCNDIVQVNDTCQLFRDVVQKHHAQALWYSQLPQQFRKQFSQSRSWLQQLVQDGLHPFINSVPARECKCLNAQHQAAVVCFHIIREMMSTSRYQPTEVFACPHFYPFVDGVGVHYALTSSNLLISSQQLNEVIVLGQSDSGSWSEQIIKLEQTYSGYQPGGSYSTNGRFFTVFGSGDLIQIYQRDSDTWQLVSQQRIETANWFKVSPSGKYLVVPTRSDGIESIRRFDDQGLWHPMALAKGVRISARVDWVEFSPSEQHVAIRYEKKVVVLSLDSLGCWKLSWETDQIINYVEFCASGSWLLIAYRATEACDGFAEMIKLNCVGKDRSQRIILPSDFQFTLSPGGNHLLVWKWCEQHLLWGLLKSDQWVLYGDLSDPGTLRWPGLGQTTLKLCIVELSSCDNYLFTSTRDGAVKIWGQDEQGSWIVRGSEQCDSKLHHVRFSRSGFHALAVSARSIRIWGRDNSGLWSVKGIIPVNNVSTADFHPTAEHLIVFRHFFGIHIWEIQRGSEPGGRQMPEDQEKNRTLPKFLNLKKWVSFFC